jgi:hypothetical protein
MLACQADVTNLGSSIAKSLSGASTIPRLFLALILGTIACQAVFGGLALATTFLWPDYATHAHHWLDQRIFTFTPIMACLNLVFWVSAFFATGWMTARIGRDGRAMWLLVGLMEIYATYIHLLRDWSKFPWWYNLFIVFSVGPVTVWSGLFWRKRGGHTDKVSNRQNLVLH